MSTWYGLQNRWRCLQNAYSICNSYPFDFEKFVDYLEGDEIGAMLETISSRSFPEIHDAPQAWLPEGSN
jgi:hypothetical protein